MPCCGDREKIGQMKLEQTWDYINLNDFKSSSCFTGFSYAMVWVFGAISIAVYAVDTFTAINLLAFNKWSSQIKPKIPINISRWIFAGAIIASFVLLFYRWFRAIRVMRSGGIAESYLDPLAVRVQSVRIGKHKGYRRFLVFAELTKSKKGADYVALFSYFSFEAWLRILLADGPRQVINAITLYSVMQLDLIPTGHNAAPDGTSPVVQFFINIKALAEKNYQQAVILFGMLFTLIVWVVAALSLALSVILYLLFLWHHIPTADGSLKRYCRRKINTRLERIVRKKTATALAKGGVQLKDRTPTMPLAAGEELKPIAVAPTLPSVAEYPEDKKPIVTVAPLSRQPTQSTLPPYTSEPGQFDAPHDDESFRQPKLPDLSDGGWLTKTNTQNSAYGESTSLTGGAAPMGYSPLDNNHYAPQDVPPVPPGSFNPNQARSYTPSINRPPTAQGRSGPQGPTPMDGMGRHTPGPGYSQTPPLQVMGHQAPGSIRGGPPERSYSPATNLPNNRPYPPRMNPPFDRQQTPQNNMRGMRPESPAYNPFDREQTPQASMRSESPAFNLPPPGRSLTAPVSNSSVMEPISRSYTQDDRSASPHPPNEGGYVAFNPFASSINTRSQSPINTNSQPIQRPSTTTPSHNNNFDSHPAMMRAATTTPSNGFGRNRNGPAQPQQRYPPVHDEEDEEYDPLSYYGSTH
ncbi:conserved hypothetical protein [Talaromyces stipitatus ATCC 10500]|uniref:Pheromone-regulated membrane protein n=1 Tax=Talaromyces stipitatus (strain ATCC 10500 / CBS 375.48 / QM 6759 / NRRL 1006) TaxID=441959 RepID=B8LV59_TALSN|nr:uncharacterized protein TSTA_065640 [Talaromyces stipitatus ATCC 10500]EED23109.1 conserved hypothetical protein [Talaromyces stipitatus ATCC 10500]